ncbi:probable serine/threonine-protein kinase MARK-A [Uranotaenia lowii]|uniref:probable serine/threonine-protein kinase MARK-A n=1 Tax=Uranotaenia lowii TaxID=190385 RepID=UPI002478EB67|nr:probable serine/threonine-protein kinase MARK-A [Uranotaenia lowii]
MSRRDPDDDRGGRDDSDSDVNFESFDEKSSNLKRQNSDRDMISEKKKTKRDHPTDDLTNDSTNDLDEERTKRKNKKNRKNNKTSNWIKNTVFKTFFIEPDTESNDTDNTNPNTTNSNNTNSNNTNSNNTNSNNTNSKNTNSDNTNVDKTKARFIHVMEIAKMLKNIEIKTYKELTQAGRGRFKITFEKPSHAEQLLNSKLLKEIYNYKVYTPKMYQTSYGVIKGIPLSLSNQEILENIECSKKVEKIERITRMKFDNGKPIGDPIPTLALKIQISGEILPENVKIYGVLAKVDPYIFPIKQCQNCWRFGHKIKSCKAKIKCKRCGQEHDTKVCQSHEPQCIHCQGNHESNDRQCPERTRQHNINLVMTTQKLTFIEAIKLYPKQPQQFRLQLTSQTEFPILQPTTSNHNYSKNTNSNKNNPTTKTTKVTEIETLAMYLKTEIMKELKMNKVYDKIKMIQSEINDQTKKKTGDWNSDLLLIKINDELNTLFSQPLQQHIIEPTAINLTTDNT